MKLQPSLSLKISLLAFFNVVLLALVFLVFAESQFRLNLSSFLFTPARDRMLSVSRLLALQLPELPADKWDQALNTLANNLSVKLYLFGDRGRQLAGPPVELPAKLTGTFHHNFFRDRKRALAEGPDHAPPAGGLPPVSMVLTNSPKEYWAAVPIPIWTGARSEPLHGDLIWRFPSLWTNSFFFDYRPWLAVMLAITGVSIACWLPLMRGLTRTISQMTKATSQIAEGHFEISLKTRRRDELGRLSQSINQMARRLSDLVGGQRRFLSDIAHELCSPVARMQAAVGILEQRSKDKALEYVRDVAEELEHMSSLINELLSFSKAQFTAAEVSLSAVNVADVASKAIEREGSEAVSIELKVASDLAVWAQPELLYRSLANLVRNAVRYAGEGGPIVISGGTEDGMVRISVEDGGPGLPEEELEKIFRPFYRPEFARQRETGGAGLGLAIVRNCMTACGGTVSCRNRIPRGLVVDVLLRGAAATPADGSLQEQATPAAGYGSNAVPGVPTTLR